jgi:Spy/CpxP family protein refolding chaperone
LFNKIDEQEIAISTEQKHKNLILRKPLITEGDNYMKRAIVIPVLIVLTLLWTYNAQAQGWGGRGRGAGQGQWGNPYGINLTDDQAKKMNGLHQAFLKDTAELNTKIDQKQLELNSLLLETNPDSQKIAALQKEISGMQSQFNEKRINYQLESRKTLTPEQLSQLPPGCTLGFGNLMGGSGYGCGMGSGYGYGCGRGPAYGCGRGAGYGCGRGPCWW